MEIKLTNTLSGKKEVFKPIDKNKVKIYSCGPTVYNYAHIGNLRAYVFADVLKRTLRANNHEVFQVINITDVGHLTGDGDEGEDKVEKEAEKERKNVWEITKFYTDSFLNDSNKLNIIPADLYPKATDNVETMIDFIKKLEKNGYTYQNEGNVYFDTSKYPDYGKMAHLNLDPEKNKSRVENDPHKKNQFDFVLWFTRYKYKNHEMMWNSPWGKGFPGWHIECSAMATKYLGEHIDIHTGGIDHIGIHHTNEIAQSEAALGHKWVNFWLHNEFLNIKDGQKMAKSSDNFLRLQTLTDQGYDPLDFRYYLLGGHYRSPMQFSFEALDHAKNSLSKAKELISKLNIDSDEPIDLKDNKLKEEFLGATNDDLNTAKALSILWKTLDSLDLNNKTKLALAKYYDQVLGLKLLETKKIEIPNEIKKLAQKRKELRSEGMWEEADRARDEILSLGYEIKDTEDGYEIVKR